MSRDALVVFLEFDALNVELAHESVEFLTSLLILGFPQLIKGTLMVFDVCLHALLILVFSFNENFLPLLIVEILRRAIILFLNTEILDFFFNLLFLGLKVFVSSLQLLLERRYLDVDCRLLISDRFHSSLVRAV